MRITAGEFRSRKIHVPNIDGLRPTSSRVREAIFNILRDVEDWRVLDLFSGSGVMALEALSRGAASAASIEQHPKACQQLKSLAKQFDLEDRWQIHCASLPHALAQLKTQDFDLIFADPPYDCGIAEQIPTWIEAQQVQTRLLIIEEATRAKPAWPPSWQVSTPRKYGDTCLYFCEPMQPSMQENVDIA